MPTFAPCQPLPRHAPPPSQTAKKAELRTGAGFAALLALLAVLTSACDVEPRAIAAEGTASASGDASSNDAIGSDAAAADGADGADGQIQLVELPAPAKSTTISGACRAYVAALALHFSLCQMGVIFRPPTDAAELDEMAAGCEVVMLAPGSTVTAADIDACTNAVHASMCETLPACSDGDATMFAPALGKVGTLSPGSPCVADLQCDSGACSATGSTCGVCLRLRAHGESCNQSTDLCKGAAGGVGFCDAGTCNTGESGDTCGPMGGNHCAQGYFCKLVQDIKGVCTANLPIGAPCAGNVWQSCIDGVCHDGTCTATVPVGGTCGPDDICTPSSNCIAGTCVASDTSARLGQPCDAGHPCGKSQVCEGVCKLALKPAPTGSFTKGEACQSQSDCEAGLACILFVCTPEPTVGAPCLQYDLCWNRDLFCDGGTCAARGHVGVPCAGPDGVVSTCMPGLLCLHNTCSHVGPAICAP